jgi:hypothetical protein
VATKATLTVDEVKCIVLQVHGNTHTLALDDIRLGCLVCPPPVLIALWLFVLF